MTCEAPASRYCAAVSAVMPPPTCGRGEARSAGLGA